MKDRLITLIALVIAFRAVDFKNMGLIDYVLCVVSAVWVFVMLIELRDNNAKR